MGHTHEFKHGRGNVEACACGRWRGMGEPIQEVSMVAASIARYESQGYALPADMTVAEVEAHHALYGTDPIYVPLACAGGVVAYGVPMVAGRYLSHD